MAKRELVKVRTPKGELHFVQISGKGKECYDESKGFEYTATIYLAGDAAKEMKAKCDAVVGTIGEKESLKSTGYKPVLKDAKGLFTPTKKRKDGEPTQFTAFQFRTNVLYEDGRQKTIDVYNGAAKKISMGRTLIGNGSLGYISGAMERTVYKGEVSCSMYLNAVQVTKLVPYESTAGFEADTDSDFDGIEDEETGFVGTEEDSDSSNETEKSTPRL